MNFIPVLKILITSFYTLQDRDPWTTRASRRFSGFSTIRWPVRAIPELFPVRQSWIPALRYKADESLVDLIDPITTELVECPPWLRMAGGGTAHRMYQIMYTRVFERPFIQMYKFAIANKRFDILGQFSVYQILLYRCLEACFWLARRLLLVMAHHWWDAIFYNETCLRSTWAARNSSCVSQWIPKI